MSMMVSFVLSFFPRDVLDEILHLIESVSEDFPSYSFKDAFLCKNGGNHVAVPIPLRIMIWRTIIDAH